MFVIDELRRQRAAALDAAKGLRADAETQERDLTEEERAKFDSYMAEMNRLTLNIKEEEQIQAAEETVSASSRVSAPQTPDPKPHRKIDIPDVRVNQPKSKHYDNNEQAYRMGKFAQAVLFGNPDARDWCREHGVEMRGAGESRAMSEGVNTAGGYLVPTEMENTIIKLRDTYGVFRANAGIIPMGRDHMVVPRWESGPTASFYTEGGAITPSDSALSQVQLTAQKLGALTYISTELAEDAVVTIADMVASDMAYAFAKKEDECGFIGTGIATYGGMTGIEVLLEDGTHDAGAPTAATNNDTFGEYTLADLHSVIGVMLPSALPGCKWYLSSIANAVCFERLKAASNGNTYADIEAGSMRPMFLGFPVVVTPTMSTVLTSRTNFVDILFGNLNLGTAFGDRRGMTIAVDASHRFAYDQIAIRGTERFDLVNHSVGDNTNAGVLCGLTAA